MVRQRVERVRNPACRERLTAEVARQHEREDAGDVGLVRDRDQVEEQGCVLLECVGYPCGGGRNIELSIAVLLAPLNTSLDFPDVVEIVAETDPIPGTEPLSQARGTVGDGIENAAIFLNT